MTAILGIQAWQLQGAKICALLHSFRAAADVLPSTRLILQVALPARGSSTGVNDGAYEFQFNRA